ncbi:hypothetical protein M153_1600008556 [Pseudoloma neurophilia]|uniref:Secreted protein n=1 Tax=Pseudoloma neurophilia TaxID=146866 RepID=A0A0R0M8R9_9MICR|nr:hypothetical protein M153_1600008556 [Pseudoloma neurophilia]
MFFISFVMLCISWGGMKSFSIFCNKSFTTRVSDNSGKSEVSSAIARISYFCSVDHPLSFKKQFFVFLDPGHDVFTVFAQVINFD